MAILLTGGAGYVGSHTSIELLNAGYEVIIVDNLSNSKYAAVSRVEELTGKKVAFYETDILDRVSLDFIFNQHQIDSVIHFAGLKAVGESVDIPLKYYLNNVSGTISLCEIMAKHNVKSLVFSSSASVYGTPETVPIKEDFPLATTNPYARTKLMIEEIFRDLYTSDNEWQIALLRYFNPIGAHASGRIGEDPNDIPNNLMPFITQVAIGKREKLSIFGNDYSTHDGTGVRDFIHVVDLAKGHLKALEKVKNLKEVEAFNLGTGKGYSVLDLINAFEKVTGLKVPYQITSRRAGDIAICYANPEKSNRELNWKAEKDIEDMCKDAWNWQKLNPNGYEEK
ncbi:MAG TPA: UDP-glucose 4-epimerase GalE [Candidatus Cloacimonadota bacterium]|nr:UDP-glucose 4-epimerase GalE [Candidatus Cloacimonadota bacterium]